MINVYEAPMRPDYEDVDDMSLFLAGGITGCPDWQSDLIGKLAANWAVKKPLTVYNPRRKDFDINNPDMTREQITWEHYYLKGEPTCRHAISFWFCDDAIQPITLLEFGRWITRKSTHANEGVFNSAVEVFVGIEPGYEREQDVRIQLELERGVNNDESEPDYGFDVEVKVVDNLDDLTNQIIGWGKYWEINEEVTRKR